MNDSITIDAKKVEKVLKRYRRLSNLYDEMYERTGKIDERMSDRLREIEITLDILGIDY